MIKISRSITNDLLDQPETGMGWQVVEFRYATNQWLTVILNGESALDLSDGVPLVREASDSQRLRSQLRTPSPELRATVLKTTDDRVARLLRAERYGTSGDPASEAPVVQSEPYERFLRFSAFENDLRIRDDGSVRDGTYVTTYEDGIGHVRTGMDAVGRYALPNPDPAIHRYHLKPPVVIPVRRGTTQPANGQPGGGAEVIFEKGAPAKTKYDQDTIPPR